MFVSQTPLRLATHNPYEELLFMTYFLRPSQGIPELVILFGFSFIHI